jgi:hypothetical protein
VPLTFCTEDYGSVFLLISLHIYADPTTKRSMSLALKARPKETLPRAQILLFHAPLKFLLQQYTYFLWSFNAHYFITLKYGRFEITRDRCLVITDSRKWKPRHADVL